MSDSLHFDYEVGFQCGIKRRFSLEELMPVLDAPESVEGLLERYTHPNLEPDSLTPITRWLPGPEGGRAIELSAAEVARRTDAVIRFRRRCKDCVANLGKSKSGFGCFGTVPLPLSADAEALMMAVVKRIVSGSEDIHASAGVPIRFVWDNGLAGKPMAALRAEGGIFERSEPLVERIGRFLAKRELSSDQVFGLFFGADRFRQEYAVLFGAFLTDFVELAEEQSPLDAASKGLLRYFQALQLAGELGVDTRLTALVAPQEPETES